LRACADCCEFMKPPPL